MADLTIELLPAVPTDADATDLARVLAACVEGGASVSFILPFSESDARAWWQAKVFPAYGARLVLVARLDGRIAGSVQLILDTPPNQPHRADVAKLLVHPEARRHGIARKLMHALEALAREHGRTLLTLDTVSGSPAETLYRSLGYELAGIIPGYARKAHTPDLEPTSIFYKNL